MGVDRKVWKVYWFTKKWTPPWPCSTCHHGSLKMVKDSLFEEESIESQRNHGDHDWHCPLIPSSGRNAGAWLASKARASMKRLDKTNDSEEPLIAVG